MIGAIEIAAVNLSAISAEPKYEVLIENVSKCRY
jgi:hypothetical protein